MGARYLRGGITQRMVLTSVALALIIGAAFATLVLTMRSARDAASGARHSQDVLLAANELEQRVLDLETGQRGFLLTRQMQFLVPWQQARAALPRDGSKLLDLVRNDSAQEARARKIIREARSYINDYSLPLLNKAARGDPAARTIPATAEGEARIGVIRSDFAGLLAAEKRTSDARERASKNATRRAYAGAVIGVGASVVLVALYAGYLSGAIVRPIRRVAGATERLARGDLAARLPETGLDEIGTLQRSFNAMASSLEQGRDELAALADEQAALRRVATLVAEDARPGDVLAAVASEIGRLLSAEYALVGRYGADGRELETVGLWSRAPAVSTLPESQVVTGDDIPATVWRTGRPARNREGRTVGVPITVEGRLWGLVAAASAADEQMPDDVETRLGRFTELVSTAIANAQAHEALAASRARLIVTADETRRRFERDLHDGAQQKFVAAALRLATARADLPPDQSEVARELEQAATDLNVAIDELREFAQGIHPVILTEGGLGPALRKLAHQSTVPVTLELQMNGRLREEVEVAAYYVVSEALVNAAKHGHATSVDVRVEATGGRLRVAIDDDGAGGAHLGGGSGLIGLKDRVEALGGSFTLQSERAAGTSLAVELPLSEVVT